MTWRRCISWLKKVPSDRWVVNGVVLFIGSMMVGTVAFQVYSANKNMKRALEITPEIQSVANDPVRCGGGWMGLQVQSSDKDFVKVRGKVIKMIEEKRITGQVNLITDDYSKNEYLQSRDVIRDVRLSQ